MSTFAWIALIAYALGYFILLGMGSSLRKQGIAEGHKPRPMWLLAVLTLAWPVNLAIEFGRHIAKNQKPA